MHISSSWCYTLTEPYEEPNVLLSTFLNVFHCVSYLSLISGDTAVGLTASTCI